MSPEALARRNEAKAVLMGFVWDYSLPPQAAAESYISAYPDVPPDPLHASNYVLRRKAWKRFNEGTKPAERLFGSLNHAHWYSLSHKHLDLPDEIADPRYFYALEGRVIKAWLDAGKEALSGPVDLKVEAGDKIHLHALADHDAGLPHIQRGGEVIKPVYDPMGIMAYLEKPALKNTRANLATWIEARRIYVRSLPRVRTQRDVPTSKVWNT